MGNSSTELDYKAILKFSTENLPTISAISIVLLICASCIFTYGYIVVFDYSILWFISYSDIIRVGFISSVFVMCFFMLINVSIFFLVDFLTAIRKFNAAQKISIFAITLFFCALSAAAMSYIGIRLFNFRPDIGSGIIILAVICMVFSILFRYRHYSGELTPRSVFSDILFALTLVLFAGFAFGLYAKNSSELLATVYLDDRVLYESRIVMSKSEYTFIYTVDGVVITVPRDRLREIHGGRKKIEF